MPNWCFSEFAFRGDKKELNELYDKVQEFTSKYRVENGFGNNWLGNVADGFGIDYNNYYCRGSVDDIMKYTDNEGLDVLNIYTCTAWEPMYELWDEIISKHYPSITYVFMAEECGNGLYINTDIDGKDFPDRFYVELNFDDGLDLENDDFYAVDKEDTLRNLCKLFNCKYTCYKQSKSRLKKKLRSKKYRGKYSVDIHKFETKL